MSKRAVIYARVSYDDRKNEARNLEGQLEDGRAYCQEKGYQIVAELAEDDRGASGADWELPGISRALDMAIRGEFDVLVCREVARFARDYGKAYILERQFQRCGVNVEYIRAKYDDTPQGRLHKNIDRTFAEYDKDEIVFRMWNGRRKLVKGNKVLLHGQDRFPYGYRLKDRMLSIYEPEARIVRFIYTWYTQGDETGNLLNMNAIAVKLTQMGVPTWADTQPGSFVRKARKWGHWERESVGKILSNETYCGVWYYGKWGKDHTDRNEKGKPKAKLNPREQWIPVEVPAIVSREVWEAAQKRKRRNRELSKRNNGRNHYLVGRRVTCQCGTRMVGKTSTSRGKKYSYYTCPAHDGQIANKTCDNRYFRVGKVDNAIWEWLHGLLLEPEQLRRKLEEQQAEQERANKHLYDRLAVIDDLLIDNRRQLEKLVDLYLSGDFPKEMLTERKTRLETTITALERERADLTMTLKGQVLTDEQVRSFEDYACETMLDLAATQFGDFEKRRQIVDDLNVEVVLSIEEGRRIVRGRCLIGEKRLSIENTNLDSF